MLLKKNNANSAENFVDYVRIGKLPMWVKIVKNVYLVMLNIQTIKLKSAKNVQNIV